MVPIDSTHGRMPGITPSPWHGWTDCTALNITHVFKMCSISPVGFSDHSLLMGVVFINHVKPRSAYWHFNTSLIDDGHFREPGTQHQRPGQLLQQLVYCLASFIVSHRQKVVTWYETPDDDSLTLIV